MTISEITDLIESLGEDRYSAPAIDGVTGEERRLLEALNRLDKKQRDAVANARDRSRLIIDSTPVAICITNENGYYEYANPRYRTLTGYAEAELVGRHFSLVVPDDKKEELTNLHDEFMGRRYELSGQWAIVSKEGRRIPILASAAYVIDYDGRPKKITFVIDVTDMVSIQEQLRTEVEERRRLEHVRDTVERMLRHDLRNPIDGIRTAAQFLMEEELPPRQEEFVRLMYDAAARARSRIDHSLAYAQMEQNTYHLDRQRLNAVQLVRDVQRELTDLLTAHRTTLETLYREEPLATQYDVELWGEAEFLHDALSHLVRNAIEAGSAGDVVRIIVDDRIERHDIDLKGTADPVAVSIEVRNRADIAPEVRDRLFDPYVTHGKRSGTGLGAYTALLVARAHGGTIDVKTGDGNGTRIALILPRGRIGTDG